MTEFTRRSLLGAALAAVASPAWARSAYRIADVDVRVSSIVAGRASSQLARQVEARLRGRGQRSGRPVRVTVELRTIDPYRPTQTFSQGRGMAVRYRVTDIGTGRTILQSRFIERTEPRENDIGTIRFATRVITRGTTERDLARGTARRILRDLS